MRAILRGSILALALVGAGCGDDDYSYSTENCVAVDYADQAYQLCCRLNCHAECDWNDCSQNCSQVRSCESSTGDPCPPGVVDDHRYPPCIY